MPTTIRSVRDILAERRDFDRFVARHSEAYDIDLSPEEWLSLYLCDRAMPTGKVGRPPSADAITLRIASGWRGSPEAEIEAQIDAARTRFARGTAPPPVAAEPAPLPPPPEARFVGTPDGKLEDSEGASDFDDVDTNIFRDPASDDALDHAEPLDELADDPALD